ncbi:hypothetical protein L2E82_49164 [Cichorium intybus]|uniref:Uncharacterized protein n=1 Tax=Cichorium intybus TaxID=13427 RepID=A0ACB8YZU5_CICIN|nr:hypothetical protein L2E82_49164 [Cichorium intybus]
MKQSVTENKKHQKQYPENDDDEEEITVFGSLFDEIVDQDEELQEHDEMEDSRELFEEVDEIPETEIDESNIEKVNRFEGKNEEEMSSQFAERSETAEEMAEQSKERENEMFERKGLPECLLLMMYEPKLSMEVSKETWVSSKDFIRRHSSKKKPLPPPPPPRKPSDGQDESKVSTTTITTSGTTKYDKHVMVEAAAAAAAATTQVQPGRSSCSLPR